MRYSDNPGAGPDKFEEALTIFEDFADKYDNTGLLLNATAVAHLQQKDYDVAETKLIEAVSKNSNDVDAMVNLTRENEDMPLNKLIQSVERNHEKS